MNLKNTVLIALLALTAGCSHFSHGHEHTSENEKSSLLSLNHGNKWKSDTSTMNLIMSMREVVRLNTDYVDLEDGLNEELNKMIKGCTMTGADHEELHTFLSALIPEINKLGSEEQKIAADALEEIKKLLNIFTDYFEI